MRRDAFRALRPCLFFSIVCAVALPARAAAAETLREVSVGVLHSTAESPLFIGVDKGYFRARGLDVHLVEFESAQPIAVAAVSGNVAFGASAITAGLLNLAAKGGLKIVSGESEARPGFPMSGLVVTPALYAAGLHEAKDIRGHSIGLTQIGSNNHFIAGRIAAKYGFSLSDLTLVPLQSFPNVVTALKGGRIDSALLPSQIALPLVRAGQGKLVAWGSDEAPSIIGAIFAGTAVVADRPLVENFLAGYRDACRDYYDTLLARMKDRKVAIDATTEPLLEIISRNMHMKIDQVAEGLVYVDRDGRLWTDSLRQYLRWFQDNKFVDASLTVEGVVAGEYAVPR